VSHPAIIFDLYKFFNSGSKFEFEKIASCWSNQSWNGSVVLCTPVWPGEPRGKAEI